MKQPTLALLILLIAGCTSVRFQERDPASVPTASFAPRPLDVNKPCENQAAQVAVDYVEKTLHRTIIPGYVTVSTNGQTPSPSINLYRVLIVSKPDEGLVNRLTTMFVTFNPLTCDPTSFNIRLEYH